MPSASRSSSSAGCCSSSAASRGTGSSTRSRAASPIRDSASNAWFIGTDLLAGIAWTAIAYGAIVILAAWLAGPSRPAVSVRQRLAPSLRDRPGLVYAIVGGLYLLVVAWGPTPAFRQPWSILVFAALTGLGVEAFRRLTVPRGPLERRAPPSPPGVRGRFDRSVQRAVARRRIFPYLAAATLILALIAGLVMTIVDEKDFPSFGLAVWWAIVTLATVGYGDVVPTTVAGRIVGSVVIILGVTFLAFLTATVTSYFVSSDQEAAKERELDEREAADRELKELLQRLEERLAAIESKLER